jgi:GTPase SAR1 family protein
MAGADPTGAALIKVGVAIIQRAAPSGIALVRSWLKGKEVLVVGQARAGKTTFIDYFHYGLFEDEKETFKTVDVRRSARFDVKMGRDAALELSVKAVVDLPGQVGASAHADEAFQRRPHAVVLITDLTRPLHGEPDRASSAWLREFCRRLEARWRADRKKRNRLMSVIVVMNKSDKAQEQSVAAARREFRKILDQELRDARGRMLEDIAIMPCTMVTNPDGTKAIDAVIAHLAKALARS